MATECNQKSFAFHTLGRREIVARFDGGRITSHGGGLLLSEMERVTGIIHQFAGCATLRWASLRPPLADYEALGLT